MYPKILNRELKVSLATIKPLLYAMPNTAAKRMIILFHNSMSKSKQFCAAKLLLFFDIRKFYVKNNYLQLSNYIGQNGYSRIV